MPSKPAGRGPGVELAIARQAGEIASAQSGHDRRRRAPDRHAVRHPLAAALTRSNIDRFLDSERVGCRVRIVSTVLRQNAAAMRPLPISCDGSTPIRACIPGVNLHFYWVFVRSNICCGQRWSRPQDVVSWWNLGTWCLQPETGGPSTSENRTHSHSRHKVLA